MSDDHAIDVRSGIPNVRPSRGIPAPYQRNRVEVGSKGEKREWRWCYAEELAPDDIVQDVGAVYTVIPVGDHHLIRGGDDNERRVMERDQVWAFTRPPKPVDRGESEVGSLEVKFDGA